MSGGHSHARTHRPANGMIGAELTFALQKVMKLAEMKLAEMKLAEMKLAEMSVHAP